VARQGCARDPERRHLGGAGSAAALAAHRFLEGSALAVTASWAVTITLVVHALAEGIAVGALLAGQSRQRLALWLAAMCLSPVAGAAAISGTKLPAAAEPLFLALAAGVLAQAALISLTAARGTSASRILAGRPAAALLAAVAVTAVAVRVGG
jgi:zinc transporter ZupT